jgi:hypothetical protein
MLLQGIDSLELTNDVAGQALAALAIGEGLGAPAPAENALLASLLGYGSEARELGSRLKPGDPVRLFVEGKSAPLRAFAESHPADAYAAYLAALSLPELGAERWEAWVKAHFYNPERSLETLHAELRIDLFETNARCAEGVIGTWMARLDPEWASSPEADTSPPTGLLQQLFDQYVESIRQRLRRKPAGILRRFEAALAKAPSTGAGPYWSADADRAWKRASFYSAVYMLGRFYIDQLSSEQGAAAYAQYLQDAPSGIASEYVEWYRHLAAWKRGENVVDALAADAGHPGLGYLAASRSLSGIQVEIIEQRKAVPAMLSAYAQQLDTRPDARYRLLDPLFNDGDTIPVSRLCQHCLELSGDGAQAYTASWCASALGNPGSLQRVASDPAQGLTRRVQSLKALSSRSDVKPDVVRTLYRRLVEESNYDRAAVAPYVFFLDDEKNYREQLRVVDGFLARRTADDLIRVIYTGRRAHCLLGLGRAAEAWTVIEPAARSGQGAVMLWASEILWALGRKDDSLALGRQIVQRYPDAAEHRAGVARLLWRADRDSEAALILGERHAGATLVWQNLFAPVFFDEFGGASPDRSIRAFRALTDQRLPFWSLEQVPKKFGRSGKSEHAFRLYEQLSGKGSWEYPWPKARAYEYLGKWKGEGEAQNWIVSHFDPKMIPTTAPVLYSTGNYELLWILGLTGAEPSDETWLLRAGGAALEGLDHAPHREQLLSHFGDPAAPDLRAHIARHVLGLETADELLRRPRKPEDDAEVAYFLGVRAYVEGRLLDAGDWLSLVPLRGKAHNFDAGELRYKIADRIPKEGLSGAHGSGSR